MIFMCSGVMYLGENNVCVWRYYKTTTGMEPRAFGMLCQCSRGNECSIHQLLSVYIENFNTQKQKFALFKINRILSSTQTQISGKRI